MLATGPAILTDIQPLEVIPGSSRGVTARAQSKRGPHGLIVLARFSHGRQCEDAPAKRDDPPTPTTAAAVRRSRSLEARKRNSRLWDCPDQVCSALDRRN